MRKGHCTCPLSSAKKPNDVIVHFLFCFLSNKIIQGRLKIWTEHSHWFLLTLKPLEILWQNFQHFYNLERYEFWPNLKGVAQKLDPPCPWEVSNVFGRKSKFWAPMTLIFCARRYFIEVNNWWKIGVDISIYFWEIRNWKFFLPFYVASTRYRNNFQKLFYS